MAQTGGSTGAPISFLERVALQNYQQAEEDNANADIDAVRATPEGVDGWASAGPWPYIASLSQALSDQVDVLHGEGDDEGDVLKACIKDESSKYQTVDKLVADVRNDPGLAYAAVCKLLPHCDGTLPDTTRFEQENVEALGRVDLSHEFEVVKSKAVEQLESFRQSGYEVCMAALEDTRQSADAGSLVDRVSAFRCQQDTLHSAQQKKNELCKLLKDPNLQVSLDDSLRECGEVQRLTLTCAEHLTKLRSLLDAEQALTTSVTIGGVPLKQGAVLLAADTVFVRKEGAQPRTFNLVEESIPDGKFWVMASFRSELPDAQGHASWSEEKYDKMETELADDRRAGIEFVACKAWESAVTLNTMSQAVQVHIDKVETLRDNFAPSAQEFEETARQLLSQLDSTKSSYDADVSEVETRLHECEQVKTDAHVEFLGSKLHAQEALAAYLIAFEELRSKHAQHELMFCLTDSLEKHLQMLKQKLDESGLEIARARAEEFLEKTREVDLRAAEITTGLRVTTESAACAVQRTHEVLDVALERSMLEREQVLEEQQKKLHDLETKWEELDQAAKQGQGKAFELRKVHGARRACQERKAALEKERGIAAQLKSNLQDVSACMMVGDDSTDPGEVAAREAGSLANQLFEVFAELTPVPQPSAVPATPSPVTTLSGLGPEMGTLVKLAVQKEMEKERTAIYAAGVKAGAKMQQQQQSATLGNSTSQLTDGAASDASGNTESTEVN